MSLFIFSIFGGLCLATRVLGSDAHDQYFYEIYCFLILGTFLAIEMLWDLLAFVIAISQLTHITIFYIFSWIKARRNSINSIMNPLFISKPLGNFDFPCSPVSK